MKIKTTKEPRNGTIRKVSGFALFPTRIDPNTIVWLERYSRFERYSDWRNGNDGWRIYDKKTNAVWYKYLGQWIELDESPRRARKPKPKVAVSPEQPSSGGRYAFIEKT